jgi:hypothetical protein
MGATSFGAAATPSRTALLAIFVDTQMSDVGGSGFFAMGKYQLVLRIT